jgi:peptidylprolyl isomerase
MKITVQPVFCVLFILGIMILSSGCTGTKNVQNDSLPVQSDDIRKVEYGDTVLVHYTGTLDDGTVFDSSREREPFEFTTGAGMVIPGFESGIIGMTEGESRTIHLSPDQAYGPYREDLVIIAGLDQFSEDIEPEIGQKVVYVTVDGSTIPAVVTEVRDGNVTLDANHILAGKNLTFEIEVIQIL